ncbi:MAG TPA: alpha/beta hydrolase [Acidimicrobiales bacterium]|nr:alpha/beta hydrolase [Acidimicrobiales bacterium]
MSTIGPGGVAGSTPLDGVTVRYRVRGDGPPVVFVHGVYVGGSLWDPLVDRLDGLRCILPTWPLGAHRDPAPHADLSALATARRIPAFLEALDLRDVTLVGNDTGGGLCLAALGCGHPGLDRVGRLVLTNCDSYEHFPPKGFDRIAGLARMFPPAVALLLRGFATGPGQRLFLKSVCVHPPSGEQARRVFEAFADSRTARADALRVTRSLEPSVTLNAVDALRTFPRPVLLAWGDQDELFPLDHARRLLGDFPDARLEVVANAGTYVMLDQPGELAELIRSFALPPGS